MWMVTNTALLTVGVVTWIWWTAILKINLELVIFPHASTFVMKYNIAPINATNIHWCSIQNFASRSTHLPWTNLHVITTGWTGWGNAILFSQWWWHGQSAILDDRDDWAEKSTKAQWILPNLGESIMPSCVDVMKIGLHQLCLGKSRWSCYFQPKGA